MYQPADTFIVSKIKDAWTKQWEAKKIELITTNVGQNTTQENGQRSRKLTNLDKYFLLQFAANSVEDVNRQVDCDNQKAMIKSSMALGIDGI